jgi:hypothetical protein
MLQKYHLPARTATFPGIGKCSRESSHVWKNTLRCFRSLENLILDGGTMSLQKKKEQYEMDAESTGLFCARFRAGKIRADA